MNQKLKYAEIKSAIVIAVDQIVLATRLMLSSSRAMDLCILSFKKWIPAKSSDWKDAGSPERRKKQYKCKQKAEYSYRWLEIVKNIEHSYYGLYFSEIREAWKKLLQKVYGKLQS